MLASSSIKRLRRSLIEPPNSFAQFSALVAAVPLEIGGGKTGPSARIYTSSNKRRSEKIRFLHQIERKGA
jgi:hypothetical protein